MRPGQLPTAAFAAAALAGLLAAAAAFGPASAAAAEFTVERRPVADLKAVFATVESIDRTPARTRIGGTIEDLAIDEGARVEAGQRLAVVGDPKLPLQVAAIDARAEALQAERQLARIELDRVAKLRETGAVSQSRLDEARTNLQVIEGNLGALQAERAVLEEQLAEGAVLAPASGRVLAVSVVEGTVVTPGETVATIATDRYILRLRLPERHARFIGEGDRVLVGARGLETAPAAEALREGRVRQVYPEIDQGLVVADVEAEGLGDYFVGERTRVFVSAGERPAILVPERHLRRRFGVVYATVKGEGEVVVQTGLPAEGGLVEILSGLRPGDVLVDPGPVLEAAR